MGAVLPFPSRNKGRVRKTRSMEAAGDLSLLIDERDGVPIPANVARIKTPFGAEIPAKTPELLLVLSVWGVLEQRQRDEVRSTLRMLTYGYGCPIAAGLHELLRKPP